MNKMFIFFCEFVKNCLMIQVGKQFLNCNCNPKYRVGYWTKGNLCGLNSNGKIG